jgi:ATP-dependent helicase HrpB
VKAPRQNHTALPIDAILPDVRRALDDGRTLVVQAPPGAGKSTRVPLALLGAPWLRDTKILMLEPRRIAARAVATYMADLLGEPVGETVGYRMRLERRVSPRTRLEVVTEGILTRMLQHDPTLDGVGLLIFDEYHERSLDADLALALTLQSQALVRDDLRVLVMSATLDGTAVASILASGAAPAPIVASEGRTFPVAVRYAPPRPDTPLDRAVASAVRTALDAHDGDVLVFLPGAGEIRRVAALLSSTASTTSAGVDVMQLYGMLDAAAQRRAILPSEFGRRKIVLATSIAETSLTIEGVRVVIDAGLARRPRFSPRTGMTRLETMRVSRAAADQRCGRAGRVAPGACYRLWSEAEEHQLLPHAPPEILNADLAPLALDLAIACVHDAASLRWLDAPPESALSQARELLRELEALDDDGRVTLHGRTIARLPVHPRSANMLVRAGTQVRHAAVLAALLGDRDPFQSEGADADLAWRVDAVLRRAAARDELRRARTEARRLEGLVTRGGRGDTRANAGHDQPLEADEQSVAVAPEHASIGMLLALAYPDRVARRRDASSGRFVLRNGRGAFIARSDPLASAEYLVVADVDDRGAEGRIRLAAAISEADIRTVFARQITTATEVVWNEAADKAEAFTRERLGALVLHQRAATVADDALLRAAALAIVRRKGLDALPWTDRARALRQRIAFVATLPGESGWPATSDERLSETLSDWLEPHINVKRGRAALEEVDVSQALAAMLDWEQRRRLDALAPERIEVPTGSSLTVDYSDPSAPSLAVRIQELFGLAETPRVGGGTVPITLELLSPSRRPVQVTRDLAGFWRHSYFEVRKDLRGRYPKHDWPEDPLRAVPSRGPRRKQTSRPS